MWFDVYAYINLRPYDGSNNKIQTENEALSVRTCNCSLCGKAQIQIQELCNTVCSQYSEEYLQLKKGTEPVDNARVQKAQAEFVTCHVKCSLSIKAQLKSLQ
ncbi:hypothetical protein T12_243 [Trichinella patagoniensis]|uniref:Uncharacterized protein n=1 Tax=Trichinella patagoniensis TaxID=990121 RepID=A0A0V0ZDE8_9BILA|nr:hypothetical protein T12_243 [Trichinella patagoniensis]